MMRDKRRSVPMPSRREREAATRLAEALARGKPARSKYSRKVARARSSTALGAAMEKAEASKRAKERT